MSGGISKINSTFELDTVLIDSKFHNFSLKTEIMCLHLQELWQADFFEAGLEMVEENTIRSTDLDGRVKNYAGLVLYTALGQ
jgi:hypothetical protein